VQGERLDILAWNRAATIIHGDLAAKQGLERNGLYQLLLGSRLRATLLDWQGHARDCVAKLRVLHARNVDDPWFNEIVQLLRDRSPEFEVWWNDHDIELSQEGVKQYEHPQVGRLVFDYTLLDVMDEQRVPLRLVTYVPAPGTGTREKIVSLLSSETQPAGELVGT
jgi:hypothetical protein